MSNPGVLTLTKKSISADKSFRVEDNLGESIHFHYNDIRIDLTIKELLYLSKICDYAIYELIRAENFNLDDFDGDFLNRYSECLMDLRSVTKDTVNADSLYYQTVNLLHLPVRKKMSAAHAKSFFVKNTDEKRDEIKRRYDVVLFNDNATIMYGKEYVAEHLLKSGKEPITVLRMNFDNKKYSVHKMPWIPFLFKWDKKRLIHTAKKLAMKVIK